MGFISVDLVFDDLSNCIDFAINFQDFYGLRYKCNMCNVLLYFTIPCVGGMCTKKFLT